MRVAICCLFATLAYNCGSALEIPSAPDVKSTAALYDAPTLAFTAQNAAEILDSFTESADQLDRVGRLEPVVKTIFDFDASITATSKGQEDVVHIKGIPLQTDAQIDIYGDCPGWPDVSLNVDAFHLIAVAKKSNLIPTLWGDIKACKIALDESIEGLSRAEFSGSVTAYFPGLVLRKKNITKKLVVFIQYAISDSRVNDQKYSPWKSHFRVVEKRYEYLVDLAQQGHVIVFAEDISRLRLGVRAANGTWQCNTEERNCVNADISDLFFSF